MGVDSVQWRQTFKTAAEMDNVRHGAPSGRYDLAAALRVVRAIESSSLRNAVFSEITAKNPLYRSIEWLYAKAGAAVLQPLLLLAYMVKCVLLPGPFRRSNATAVSISNFANERHSLDRIAKLVPDTQIEHLSLRRRNFWGHGQFGAAVAMIIAAPRVWPYLRRLAKSHSLMPSARIASALAFYIRFRRMFDQRPSLQAAIVASNYSPEAVGLMAAAHQTGRRVIYTNHASVAANCPVVPPVLADCAVFYGDAITRTYNRRSRCIADVALIGQPWTSRAMQWTSDIQRIGIFLTALTEVAAVSDLVAAIRSDRPDVEVLIRNHPVALLQSDFSELQARHANVKVTIGNSLDDEIADCDIIFCGNSGVAINVLSGGRPLAYVPALDSLSFDYNGFVESGLICPVETWNADVYDRLRQFYQRPEWREVMRGYDAAYGTDAKSLQETAAETLRRYLS